MTKNEPDKGLFFVKVLRQLNMFSENRILILEDCYCRWICRRLGGTIMSEKLKVRGLDPAKVIVSCVAILMLVWLSMVLVWSNRLPQNQPAAREARRQMDTKARNTPESWKRQRREATMYPAPTVVKIETSTNNSVPQVTVITNSTFVPGFRNFRIK